MCQCSTLNLEYAMASKCWRITLAAAGSTAAAYPRDDDHNSMCTLCAMPLYGVPLFPI